MVNEAIVVRAFEGCWDYSRKKKDECLTDPSPYVSRGKLSIFPPSNLAMAQTTCGFRVADEAIMKKIQTSFGMSECPIRVVSIFPSGVGRDQLMNRLPGQHSASLSIDNLWSSGETLHC